MNKRFDSQFAEVASEPVAPVDTPELRGGAMVKPPAVAMHPGHLRAAARRRLPSVIFDFLEGGSNDEVTLARNFADFDALRLNQRVFDHVASRNLRTTLFGQRAAMPVALAPIGVSGVFHPGAEIHAARAAAAFGVPSCISTLSSFPMEEVAAAVNAPFLFQLYVFRDRAINSALLQRAERLNCPGIIVTVDTAVQGRRNLDLDNGIVVLLLWVRVVIPRYIDDYMTALTPAQHACHPINRCQDQPPCGVVPITLKYLGRTRIPEEDIDESQPYSFAQG